VCVGHPQVNKRPGYLDNYSKKVEQEQQQQQSQRAQLHHDPLMEAPLPGSRKYQVGEDQHAKDPFNSVKQPVPAHVAPQNSRKGGIDQPLSPGNTECVCVCVCVCVRLNILQLADMLFVFMCVCVRLLGSDALGKELKKAGVSAPPPRQQSQHTQQQQQAQAQSQHTQQQGQFGSKFMQQYDNPNSNLPSKRQQQQAPTTNEADDAFFGNLRGGMCCWAVCVCVCLFVQLYAQFVCFFGVCSRQ
jgi:hypothetical protein